MTLQLRYGADSVIDFDIGETAIEGGQPDAAPLDNVVEATKTALISPREYPSLVEATVPGDRIVIALEDGVPQAAELVAGVVDVLLEGHAEPSEIEVIITPEQAGAATVDPRSALAAEIAEQIELKVHDPGEREKLTYIAGSEDGRGIYVARDIGDADVVIPIGCMRIDETVGYHGIHHGLFPSFADADTQERFRSPTIDDIQVTRRRRREEAEEAVWKLGAMFTLQVVPAGGSRILQLFAGEYRSVWTAGQAFCESHWRCHLPHRVGLVVAAISEASDSQGWENIGRAVATARHAVEDGGAIALCCDLAEVPGTALKYLMSSEEHSEEDHAVALHAIRREKTRDAAAAAQVALALDQAKVFLVSRLDVDTVFDLGMAAVDDADDLARLAKRYDTQLLLSNAQYAVVAIDDEIETP